MQPFEVLNKRITSQFDEIVDIILSHRNKALQAVNTELVHSAWHVVGYVSSKLKSEEWGSKVVAQLAEYIRIKRPELKGYSRSSLYNFSNCPATDWTIAQNIGIDNADQSY